MPLGIDSYETRNIVAEGMTRFEGIGKIPPPQPNIERLSSRVVNILGMNPSPYTLNGTNCYLVGTGPRRILIDAGESPLFGGQEQHEDFISNVEQALQQENCTGLDLIIVTHLHVDHWGGVEKLQKLWGPAPVAMLPAETWTYELYTMNKVREHGLLDVLKEGPSSMKDGKYDWDLITKETELPMWPDEDLSWDMYGRRKYEIQRDFWWCELNASFYEAWFKDDGSIPAMKLQHGQVIRTEGATLRVMHTPGHTPNHAALVLEEEHSLFSGDHVLGYGTTVFDDLYDYMASLQAMLQYEPVRLYPGHGPVIADGAGLLKRYVQHRQVREDQIVAFCTGQSLTATTIAQALYGNTPSHKMQYARENVERVMCKLWREGRVNCYTDASKSKMADLPEWGYAYRLGQSFVWDWQASTPSDIKKLDFISLIASAANIMPKAKL